MSEEVSTETTETTDTLAVDESTEATETTPERVEDLPEFAQKLISKLRDEAKNNRLKGKAELEKALAAANDEHAAALAAVNSERDELASERDTKNLEMTRLRAALNAGVQADLVDQFASRLKGETAEEIEADAVELAEIFQKTSKPERKSDPSQGSHLALNGDPILNMLNNKLGI